MTDLTLHALWNALKLNRYLFVLGLQHHVGCLITGFSPSV